MINQVFRIHRIACGETVDSICKFYNVSKVEILSCNNLKKWEEGKFALIPRAQAYVVLPGDTLEIIASKFNTSVQEIKQKNNIEAIFIGQKLNI